MTHAGTLGMVLRLQSQVVQAAAVALAVLCLRCLRVRRTV